MTELLVFQAYRITTAVRTIDLLFRGRVRNRLWFTELDPPYADVFLRPVWIRSAVPIDGQRAV